MYFIHRTRNVSFSLIRLAKNNEAITGITVTDKINAERAERGEPPLSDDTGGRPKREGGGDRDRGRSRR